MLFKISYPSSLRTPMKNANIEFLIWEGYYGIAISSANQLIKRGSNPEVLFWRAVAEYLSLDYISSQTTFLSIKTFPEFVLSATYGLYVIEKVMNSRKREGSDDFSHLSAQIDRLQDRATFHDLCRAAKLVFLFNNDQYSAMELIDKANRLVRASNTTDLLLIRSTKAFILSKSLNFDDVIDSIAFFDIPSSKRSSMAPKVPSSLNSTSIAAYSSNGLRKSDVQLAKIRAVVSEYTKLSNHALTQQAFSSIHAIVSWILFLKDLGMYEECLYLVKQAKVVFPASSILQRLHIECSIGCGCVVEAYTLTTQTMSDASHQQTDLTTLTCLWSLCLCSCLERYNGVKIDKEKGGDTSEFQSSGSPSSPLRRRGAFASATSGPASSFSLLSPVRYLSRIHTFLQRLFDEIIPSSSVDSVAPLLLFPPGFLSGILSSILALVPSSALSNNSSDTGATGGAGGQRKSAGSIMGVGHGSSGAVHSDLVLTILKIAHLIGISFDNVCSIGSEREKEEERSRKMRWKGAGVSFSGGDDATLKEDEEEKRRKEEAEKRSSIMDFDDGLSVNPFSVSFTEKTTKDSKFRSDSFDDSKYKSPEISGEDAVLTISNDRPLPIPSLIQSLHSFCSTCSSGASNVMVVSPLSPSSISLHSPIHAISAIMDLYLLLGRTQLRSGAFQESLVAYNNAHALHTLLKQCERQWGVSSSENRMGGDTATEPTHTESRGALDIDDLGLSPGIGDMGLSSMALNSNHHSSISHVIHDSTPIFSSHTGLLPLSIGTWVPDEVVGSVLAGLLAGGAKKKDAERKMLEIEKKSGHKITSESLHKLYSSSDSGSELDKSPSKPMNDSLMSPVLKTEDLASPTPALPSSLTLIPLIYTLLNAASTLTPPRVASHASHAGEGLNSGDSMYSYNNGIKDWIGVYFEGMRDVLKLKNEAYDVLFGSFGHHLSSSDVNDMPSLHVQAHKSISSNEFPSVFHRHSPLSLFAFLDIHLPLALIHTLLSITQPLPLHSSSLSSPLSPPLSLVMDLINLCSDVWGSEKSIDGVQQINMTGSKLDSSNGNNKHSRSIGSKIRSLANAAGGLSGASISSSALSSSLTSAVIPPPVSLFSHLLLLHYLSGRSSMCLSLLSGFSHSIAGCVEKGVAKYNNIMRRGREGGEGSGSGPRSRGSASVSSASSDSSEGFKNHILHSLDSYYLVLLAIVSLSSVDLSDMCLASVPTAAKTSINDAKMYIDIALSKSFSITETPAYMLSQILMSAITLPTMLIADNKEWEREWKEHRDKLTDLHSKIFGVSSSSGALKQGSGVRFNATGLDVLSLMTSSTNSPFSLLIACYEEKNRLERGAARASTNLRLKSSPAASLSASLSRSLATTGNLSSSLHDLFFFSLGSVWVSVVLIAGGVEGYDVEAGGRGAGKGNPGYRGKRSMHASSTSTSSSFAASFLPVLPVGALSNSHAQRYRQHLLDSLVKSRTESGKISDKLRMSTVGFGALSPSLLNSSTSSSPSHIHCDSSAIPFSHVCFCICVMSLKAVEEGVRQRKLRDGAKKKEEKRKVNGMSESAGSNASLKAYSGVGNGSIMTGNVSVTPVVFSCSSFVPILEHHLIHIHTSSSTYKIVALMMLSTIYLKIEHSQDLYVACFWSFVKSCPSCRSYVLLAHAFLSIGQPLRAVYCYESAHELVKDRVSQLEWKDETSVDDLGVDEEDLLGKLGDDLEDVLLDEQEEGEAGDVSKTGDSMGKDEKEGDKKSRKQQGDLFGAGWDDEGWDEQKKEGEEEEEEEGKSKRSKRRKEDDNTAGKGKSKGSAKDIEVESEEEDIEDMSTGNDDFGYSIVLSSPSSSHFTDSLFSCILEGTSESGLRFIEGIDIDSILSITGIPEQGNANLFSGSASGDGSTTSGFFSSVSSLLATFFAASKRLIALSSLTSPLFIHRCLITLTLAHTMSLIGNVSSRIRIPSQHKREEMIRVMKAKEWIKEEDGAEYEEIDGVKVEKSDKMRKQEWKAQKKRLQEHPTLPIGIASLQHPTFSHLNSLPLLISVWLRDLFLDLAMVESVDVSGPRLCSASSNPLLGSWVSSEIECMDVVTTIHKEIEKREKSFSLPETSMKAISPSILMRMCLSCMTGCAWLRLARRSDLLLRVASLSLPLLLPSHRRLSDAMTVSVKRADVSQSRQKECVENALNCFEKAHEIIPFISSPLEMAACIYKDRKEWEKVKATCELILSPEITVRASKARERATVFIAEASYNSGHKTLADKKLSSLLRKDIDTGDISDVALNEDQPIDDVEGLQEVVNLLKRAGRLHQGEKHILKVVNTALTHNKKHTVSCLSSLTPVLVNVLHPSLSLICGVFLKETGRANAALCCFNHCRQNSTDLDEIEEATVNLILCFLSPSDDMTIGAHLSDVSDSKDSVSGQLNSSGGRISMKTIANLILFKKKAEGEGPKSEGTETIGTNKELKRMKESLSDREAQLTSAQSLISQCQRKESLPINLIYSLQALLACAEYRQSKERIKIEGDKAVGADKALRSFLQSIKDEKRAALQAIEKKLLKALDIYDKDALAMLAALGVVEVHLKQLPKARNYLKQLVTLKSTERSSHWFVRGALVLAELYIAAGKIDLTLKHVKSALHVSQSCARAHELWGFVCEKEGAFADAADHYEKAWELCTKNKATLGYRLAFNLMKAEKPRECVQVCSDVIAKWPEYTGIKTHILYSAASLLREEPKKK
ncbi:Tetratricopeptide repeat protein 21A/21B like protein [Aduncisulcus paluster]|uniref:Tetratricopeptide repeat protein 21A/21B like protein n=1 Tax=Aduncisulcus paluster TaxID=2918883 RepID=A0ABQ5KYZ3_9EUKA|nr:Tetratricopeptide repeat protein 21A/21B like protein [Aduncisulcus paluster]